MTTYRHWRSSTDDKILELFFLQIWHDHVPPLALGAGSSRDDKILELFFANRAWPPTANVFLPNPTVKLSLQISNQILPATVFWSLSLTYGKNS